MDNHREQRSQHAKSLIMFLLFKNTKSKKQLYRVVTKRVTDSIEERLRQYAKAMQKHSDRLSRREQKISLLLFLFLSITACVSVIVTSLADTGKATLLLGAIQKPKYSTYKQQQQSSEKRYLDVLQLIPTDKTVPLKIPPLRQGLRDSLQHIQTIISKQQKQTSWKRQNNY